ncbi:MAG: serine/threonine protein kinase [Chloracidobacterium sp.]|nr:serine/threonine protein kinase [Chloracidobacterium sp.]
MIEAGTTLQQRYRIDKQIGQGGMGAVYVATDERFNSIVAIKETLCMDDNFLKAIEREARLLNSLKHSALPRVSDHFLERESQFLVMEYIQGEDLGRMLEDQDRPFDVEQVLKWADQLLDALDYLHNQNMPVVHRDIKPQNLKITHDGQIILLDFGLAKGNPTDAGHKTAAKSIFGYSRNYASLEQIQGTGTDPRSDLYSLAATLYHLLTNTAPEDALTRAMSVLSQKPDPLIPANLVNSNVPPGVAGVLQKALDLNAGERPASAAEMRQMFRESENYAHLAVASAYPTQAFSTNVYSQPTKLMSDETRAAALMNTDVKTEFGSAFVSDETSVSPNRVATGGMTGSTPKRRALAMAVGALIVLLVGGGIAGGLYVVNPSLFGVTQETEKTAQPQPLANTNSTRPTNAEAVQMAAETAVNANSAAAPIAENPRSAEKPLETTKTGKSSSDNAKTADESFDIIGDPEDPDQVTIKTVDKTGKVTTMTVRPKEIPDMPVPPVEGYDPFPPKVDPSKLTPAQRRKLQRVWRFNQIRPTPNTQQTPTN